MKKLILFIFLLFFGILSYAQIEFSPDSVSVNGTVDDTELLGAFEVTVSGTENLTVWWKLIKEEFPKDWSTQVCDANTCYFENVDKCPTGNPNSLVIDSTYLNFSVKIKPHGVESSTLMYFKVYTDSDCTQEIASLPLMVNVGTVSTKEEVSDREIAIFPNPTVDKFMLNHSDGIDKLEIYNIAGKKMKTFTVTAGREYPVNELRNGLYLLRFVDKNGKVEKVVRLSKR